MKTTLLLDLTAESIGDRPAVGSRSGGLAFGQLRSAACEAASALAPDGSVQAIVYVGLNGAAMPVAMFAAGYAGLPFVPLNYRLTDAELCRLLARNAPAAVVIDDAMASRIAGVEGLNVHLRSDFERRFLSATPGMTEQTSDTEQDVAVLLFTSGTTGDPKAAVLRHSNLVSYIMSTGEFLSADEEDAALVSVPPYHIAGVSAVLSSCYSGRRIVYLPQFSADDWVAVAARERITHAMVVPTMLEQILSAMERQGESLPALRALSYGGGRMPETTILRAMERLPNVDFVNAYGLTETSSTIALLDGDAHRTARASKDPAIRRRLTSVGRTLPMIELEIRDANGKPCPTGESGEIFVRGAQVSGEYLNRPSLVEDGWFATRDGGWLDEDQFLYIDGRLDDVIVRGGENISPGEIEDVLRSHPGVMDVAVLGLPCDLWGEKVAAVIASTPGYAADEKELLNYVKGKLRSTKTPEAWFFRAELPYSETGKLLRRALRVELG